jgi:hypothetical protein
MLFREIGQSLLNLRILRNTQMHCLGWMQTLSNVMAGGRAYVK